MSSQPTPNVKIFAYSSVYTLIILNSWVLPPVSGCSLPGGGRLRGSSREEAGSRSSLHAPSGLCAFCAFGVSGLVLFSPRAVEI